MKKLFFTAALSLLVMGAFAQKKVLKNAEKAFKKGAYEEAVTLAKQAAEDAETSGSSDVYTLLGKISLQKFIDGELKNLDEARESLNWFNKALELADDKTKEDILDPALPNPLDPTTVIGGEQIGLLEYELRIEGGRLLDEEEFAAAYPFLDLIYQISPSVDGAFFAGYAADNADQEDNAMKYFKIVIAAKEAYDNKSYAYQKLIQRNIDTEMYDDAISVIRNAKDTFPDEALYGTWEVDVLIRAEKMDEAIANLNKIVAAGNAEKVTYYTLGFLQFNNNQYKEAEANAKKAIEMDPEYMDAYYVAGISIFNQGVDLLTKAGSIDDRDAYEAYKEEGKVKFREALPMFEKLIAAEPEDVYALRPLSTIYDQLGMDEKRDKVLDTLDRLAGGE